MTSATGTLAVPDPETIRRDLREKFAWMRRIHDAAARGEAPDRVDLRALAAAFPGALRELDDTPPESIADRAEELERPGPLPDWACATWLYHAALRADLDATRSGARPLGSLVERAIRAVSQVLGLDEASVTRLALPHARRRRR